MGEFARRYGIAMVKLMMPSEVLLPGVEEERGGPLCL